MVSGEQPIFVDLNRRDPRLPNVNYVPASEYPRSPQQRLRDRYRHDEFEDGIASRHRSITTRTLRSSTGVRQRHRGTDGPELNINEAVARDFARDLTATGDTFAS